MLETTADVLSSQATSGSMLHNSVLESFLVHLRNLIDFLYLPKCKKDDVLAEDYFQDPEVWLKLRPLQGNDLKKAKQRTNKLLSHLTYTRLKMAKSETQWDHISLRSEIMSRIAVFLDNVPKDLIIKQLRKTEHWGAVDAAARRD